MTIIPNFIHQSSACTVGKAKSLLHLVHKQATFYEFYFQF